MRIFNLNFEKYRPELDCWLQIYKKQTLFGETEITFFSVHYSSSWPLFHEFQINVTDINDIFLMSDDHFSPNVTKQNVPYLHTQFNKKKHFFSFFSGRRNGIITLTISHLGKTLQCMVTRALLWSHIFEINPYNCFGAYHTSDYT